MDLSIAICVPTAGRVPVQFAHSLASLSSFLCSSAALAQLPDCASLRSTIFVMESSVIHLNRENLVTEAMKWGATHVLFLDDDMQFDPRAVAILAGRRQPMVACNYTKRGFPVTFTAVRPDGGANIITREESSGMEPAAYTGFGVALISVDVFKSTPKPWFLPLYVESLATYTTEDNPFCERIKRAGFQVYVDHDASKLVAHVGAHVYDWRQWQPPALKKESEQ